MYGGKIMWASILQSLLFAFILSIDCFFSTLGFGISKVKIPCLSVIIIALTNFFLVSISCCISFFVSGLLSEELFNYISFALVFGAGLLLLCEEIINHFTKESPVKNPLFRLLSDSKLADRNKDKILSPKEAVVLGLVLASDGFSIGLSVGKTYSVLFLPIFVIIFSIAALTLGNLIGKRISKGVNLNLSWLCGLFLIIIAITKFFF